MSALLSFIYLLHHLQCHLPRTRIAAVIYSDKTCQELVSEYTQAANYY